MGVPDVVVMSVGLVAQCCREGIGERDRAPGHGRGAVHWLRHKMNDLGLLGRGMYGGLGKSRVLVNLEFGWVRFMKDNELGI